MINFMLPGLYEKFHLNKVFIEFFYSHREMFYEDINLYCVYGSFPFSIWDGGRIFGKYEHASREQILDMIDFYHYFGLKHRLICTNPELKEQHLNDDFMNCVLTLCDSKEYGEIVINSPLLQNYIIEKYPNYSIISSTTKRLIKYDDFIKELENPLYKMTCLDYDVNNNFKILDKIPEDLRPKCEFLINAICPPGCPARKEHYKLNGRHMLNYGKVYGIDCEITSGNLHPEVMNRKNYIGINTIYQDYVPRNFINFKIEGRTFNNYDLLGNYIAYLVKPEYQLYVFSQIASLNIPDYNK